VNLIVQEVAITGDVAKLMGLVIKRNATQILIVSIVQLATPGFMDHIVNYPVLIAVSHNPGIQVVIIVSMVTGELPANTIVPLDATKAVALKRQVSACIANVKQVLLGKSAIFAF
jgi:hypothetical protein